MLSRFRSLTFFLFALVCFPVFAAENAFDHLSEEWAKSFIFEDSVYSEIFMGLQIIGDSYLMNQYEMVSNDEQLLKKIEKLKKEGLEKITVQKNKAIPYILSDLISNEGLRQDASTKYNKLGWNVPVIVLRAAEARDQAIQIALLALDKDDVLKELGILKNKLKGNDSLGALSLTVDSLKQAIEEKNSKKN